MTAPSLPDALATIARLDGTMRPAVEAARDCVIDDYADALYRYRSATRHPNSLALLDAASAPAKHIEAETKRADAAEREREEAHLIAIEAMAAQKRAETALAAARETIARLTAVLALSTEDDALLNLEGALIDLDHLGADAVCRATVRRVCEQLGRAARLLADLKPADAMEGDHG